MVKRNSTPKYSKIQLPRACLHGTAEFELKDKQRDARLPQLMKTSSPSLLMKELSRGLRVINSSIKTVSFLKVEKIPHHIKYLDNINYYVHESPRSAFDGAKQNTYHPKNMATQTLLNLQ